MPKMLTEMIFFRIYSLSSFSSLTIYGVNFGEKELKMKLQVVQMRHMELYKLRHL